MILHFSESSCLTTTLDYVNKKYRTKNTRQKYPLQIIKIQVNKKFLFGV